MDLSEKPLVTAVITTYKRNPDIVRRALESIVKQSYENIEIFVVNDYPDDKNLVGLLRQKIDEFVDLRFIRYLVVDKNGGACKARNLALSNANGKYFACLDDDDEWLPDKIRLQVEKMEQDSEAAIVYCNAYIRYENQGRESIRFKHPQSEGDIYFEMIARNNIGSCSFPMFRTDVLKHYGGFDVNMPALQDWELYLRLLKENKALYVHEPAAIYYLYVGERISAHPENRTKAFENIHRKIKEDLNRNKKSASAFYLMGTYFYSLSNDMVKAFHYYILGVKKDPMNLKRNMKDFFRMMGRKFVKPKSV